MKLTEHIHALKIPFKVTINPDLIVERFVYVYLICGGKAVTLIDTGVAGSKDIIFAYLERIGRKPQDIRFIILTHSHPDHIGAAKSIKESIGCAIMMHAAELDWAEDTDRQFRERPVPGFHSLVEGSVKIEKTFDDGDIIGLDDDLNLRTIHTPGHSAGSCCFFLEKEKILFCGDAILSTGQMPIFDDIRACMDSLDKLKQLPVDSKVFSSWDDPRADLTELIDDSIAYLIRIKNALSGTKPRPMDPLEFCRSVINKLNLPPAFINPLTARSFKSIV
jgi:glyoxylase-like metal-dependent hydrolase (beta-lactamase superfamily II)